MNPSAGGNGAHPPARSPFDRGPGDAPNIITMKNTLIATISTLLSHYFSTRFIQSGWLAGNYGDVRRTNDPRIAHRRLLEVKTRFLYCIKVAIQRLQKYEGKFSAETAFREDVVTDRLEIISTPEHQFADDLLNKCTEIMVTDLSSVQLTDSICGQFLRLVFQMIRRDLNDPEHIKYVYLFCLWKMPEVLFDLSVTHMVRRREIDTLVSDPRTSREMVESARAVRAGGLFPRDGKRDEPVDEGWDLEQRHVEPEPPKRPAWQRLFSRWREKKDDTPSLAGRR